MTKRQQIKFHLDNKKYCKIKRKVSADSFEYSNGYIVDSSNDFIVFQETDDFLALGYEIFTISSIEEIRFNNNDKYYDKIMVWEKESEKIRNKHKINLNNWESIFKSIKKIRLNVIIENENPDDFSFDIGPIEKVTKTSVQIRYFDAKGYLDDKPTKITYDLITKVKFNDRYINVFSKYLRKKRK